MRITTLEMQVFSAIKECIEKEDIYCCHVTGIADYCDLTISQIKGCIGSMIKKKLIQEVEPNHFDTLPSSFVEV